ncbi:MAG TPA: thioredoxin-like domain-containing protein [Leptospiraceae bacterium]|nr:thioredoxin-like domain-containing protein [Leptospiraceae bacterium]HMW06061.1 thioredoxin-like domain-containing protein [Leptospiraceae bacterium]HMX33931.1 thioredoxin-like domain-containing protein [Leptospiraceae bacterium]HMY31397.1 thioredoxin-like domain-containing protein [Leptospiraceae bacterium]HMZ64983.1 thioredoxin-like domain-containing protein [Leptospiraceae bacterium]
MKVFVILLALTFCKITVDNKDLPPKFKYGGTEPAFEFPVNAEWVNLKESISIEDLKGKITLLYFWKFTSIHCLQSLEEVKKLEKKWKKELIPIGIHAAKFTEEKKKNSILNAIYKLDIKHPVLNDKDFFYSSKYNVNSWPYFVLIDPTGNVLGIHIGEGFLEGFDKIIEGMVLEFQEKSLINFNPIQKLQTISFTSKSKLSFPTKIIFNQKGTEIFISDSHHNQVLRVDVETKKILDRIGSGEKGFKDGLFSAANFYSPQGMVLNDNLLYIADSKNHSIRIANLKTKNVSTLIGNGEQAKGINVTGKGVSLISPSELILYKNKLYVTMQGAHQIWTVDISNGEADIYAGQGNENLFDGSLQEASFAQPISITRDNVSFYITDAETSSIRKINYKSKEKVKTLIGRGLLEFGDINGKWEKAKLQYPMAITYSNGFLYLADTLNHKIKQVDLLKEEITTLAGSGKEGADNGSSLEARFSSPEGIAVFKNKIFIADTNNHSIRFLDLETNIVSNFDID